MGFTSIWHWIIVLAVVLILFARPGKISGIMGDFGTGLRSFKEGVKNPSEDEEDAETIEEAPAKKPPLKKLLRRKCAKKISKEKNYNEEGGKEKQTTLAMSFAREL